MFVVCGVVWTAINSNSGFRVPWYGMYDQRFVCPMFWRGMVWLLFVLHSTVFARFAWYGMVYRYGGLLRQGFYLIIM